jgi:tetratricopeptide (TPR) repeat protein
VRQWLLSVKTKEQYFKPQYIDTTLDHLDKNNVAEAIKTLERAEHEIPEFLDKYLESEFYLKFMFGGKGKDDEFIIDYTNQLQQAVDKYPDYADLRNNLGIAYLIRCRNLFLNALEEFREALKINPEYKKAEKNLKLAENDGKGFLILLRAILK